MIDIKKVVKEIGEKKKELEFIPKGRIATRLNNQVVLLQHVADYLNTFPSEDFIKKEIERLDNRLGLINVGFKSWIPSKYFEKEKDKLKEYLKEMGVPKIKSQLKALKFILNEN